MGNVIDLQRYREKKINPLSDLIAYLAKWKGSGGDILSTLHDTMTMAFASTRSRDYDHLLGYEVIPDMDAGTINMEIASAIASDPARPFIDVLYYHGEVKYPPVTAPDIRVREAVSKLLSSFTEGGVLVTWPYAVLVTTLIQHLYAAGWIVTNIQSAGRHGFKSAVLIDWIHPDLRKTVSLTVDLAVPYADIGLPITSEDNAE